MKTENSKQSDQTPVIKRLKYMDPKEKAIELYERFYYAIPSQLADKTQDFTAKKCATICVNEILQTNPTIKGNSEDLVTMIVQTKAYWYQVIDAINAL
jgi:hypothetical protein